MTRTGGGRSRPAGSSPAGVSQGTFDVAKVLVLGAGGMLGHTLLRFLAESPGVVAVGSVRSAAVPEGMPPEIARRVETGVDATDEAALRALLATTRPDAVVNCVGLIKQRPDGQDPERTIIVNALVPHLVARLSAEAGARLIHLSTDCVFSGAAGNYTEDSVPDAVDFYGRSKLLGEVVDGDAVTLRTSIIGPEIGSGLGLLAWFLGQTGPVPGYRRAIFSGLPTVELARVIRDHVLPFPELHGLYHVSAQPISKLDLLGLVKTAYDAPAEPVPDDRVTIDRSLDSSRFRAATGYDPPEWPALVAAMKAFG